MVQTKLRSDVTLELVSSQMCGVSETVWDIDRSSLRYKITSRVTGFSSWSSTHSPFRQPSQMLIIKSLILAVSFLTQVAVLAAPIPLEARALSLDGDAIVSRAGSMFVSLVCT